MIRIDQKRKIVVELLKSAEDIFFVDFAKLAVQESTITKQLFL